MNRDKIKIAFTFFIGALSAFLVMYFINNYKTEKKHHQDQTSVPAGTAKTPLNNTASSGSIEIDELTEEHRVIDYVKTNRSLPDYYITKSEAKKHGWVPSQGNLCEVLPGRAIGGDRFSNRERALPVGSQYFEADVNYRCGNRNADRIVFNTNGEVWLTKDHYKTFRRQ